MASPSIVVSATTVAPTSSTSNTITNFAAGTSGSNRLMVFLMNGGENGNATSATFNSNSFTVRNVSTGNQFAQTWGYLIDTSGHTQGTHDFVINYPSSAGVRYALFVLQDVDQTNVFDQEVSTGPVVNTSPITVNVTTAFNNELLTAILSSGVLSPSTTNNQSSLFASFASGGGDGQSDGAYWSLSTAGATSVVFTNPNTGGNQGMAISFRYTAPPAGPANWKTWNTVTVSTNLKTLNTNTLANTKTYDTIT